MITHCPNQHLSIKTAWFGGRVKNYATVDKATFYQNKNTVSRCKVPAATPKSNPPLNDTLIFTVEKQHLN